jgi:uncharacterized protein YodC (DUF2158 family)
MKDGGPAFPVSDDASDMQGMSLRDWFAGQALAKIAIFDADKARIAVTVVVAYQYADAMLCARPLEKTWKD